MVSKFVKYISFVLLSGLCSCHWDDNMPKPIGYFKISLPEKTYVQFDKQGCPYTFEINKAVNISDKNRNPCWHDLNYTVLHSVIQLTYRPIHNNLDTLLKDAREFAYKHGVKADGIAEKIYIDPDRKVYGILYEIYGNTATNYQFFATDSLRHFIRGTAYVHSQPNLDSTAPVTHFLGDEIRHLMETLQWK
ncbi:gliding motility lipoprotein GldD [Schleiferia thermophila]|jgi:gliding motility-associated lipoprotein GldD|uniref:Protein involved in gliding motility GldD n=1 Tax=Schleiferia thermophila TaxID=884107 RepID=A0A369A681_9FLAO|nr:gliding motility lipoprotein GldD [Schleiferia thermophila]KFD38487.1 gliding motility protein GldD [Schleiferia thermophila str. Yellowstone]RCX03587.1 protein involved in gliding motility GldD [Schleiferia thermophila]GCD79823.1 gliding motility lipoprotein GldD [Schleiferia thermophila]